MPKVTVFHHALNVGQVDKRHLARVDLEKLRLAAERQLNLLPLTTGPAFMRPGLEFLTTTASNNACRVKEFIFGATDAVLMEFTDLLFRARVDDTLVTRPAVTAAVTSGDFSASTGWTLTATSGASCTVSLGFLNMSALARGSRATASQTVTVNQQGTEHALRVVVSRGPVVLRVGSTSGGDEYINETALRTGTHSLAFTPTTASFFIAIHTESRTTKLVDSITVEGAGVMTLPTIWPASVRRLLRFAQSADVVFVACDGYRPQRIERRSNRSWSVVDYAPDTGPLTADRTRNVKLDPTVVEGNGTLTASAPFFNSSHVGALFSLFHEGFRSESRLAGNGQYSDAFKVTGVRGVDDSGDEEYNDRDWTWSTSGTWSGTLRWYRSFDGADTGFKEFRNTEDDDDIPITNPVNTNIVNEDRDDNAIIWYKLGFAEGSYTSGTAQLTISYDGGGGSGICRVTGYTSSTSVSIEVLSPFSGNSATADWREGEWSANQVWPSAVTFAEGRLWWSGQDRLWGSVSDDFENFDDEVEGDSGPISRSIATGGVNATQWLMALQRLLIGTNGAVATCKSSSLDEPLTPTNLSIKDSSSTGAAPVDPVKVDGRGLFIERSGKALMELTYDGSVADYVCSQLSKLATDVFAVGVAEMAVQRRPDTRIWLIMEDGTCVCCVYEPLDEVLAFIPVETDGEFESVAVLPADDQDRVYFTVARSINGSPVRYVEKMALDSEVAPDTLCKVMDAFKTGTNGPASTTIAVGTHLIGETVVVWADGAPLTQTADGLTTPRTFTVNGSGNITVPSAVTNWVAGLPYDVEFKSARLAYAAANGTAMLQKKKVDAVGMILTDFTRAGIRVGTHLDNADRPMFPLRDNPGYTTGEAIVRSDIHDEEMFDFPGEWGTDSRLCFKWQSPFTATVLGVVLTVETSG